MKRQSHVLRTLVVMLAAAVTALPPAAVRAQRVAGVGEDAVPIPKGGYRILVGGLWNDHDAVFTPGGTQRTRGLLSALSTDSLGIGLLPQLSTTQAGIRALSGNSGFALSLGALEARGEVRQSIVPFALDYGLTRRLSLRVLVPYAESRDVSQLILNRVGTGANVGRNPAFGTTGAAVRATNGAVVGQIESARAALAAEITRCANAAAAGCNAIRANPAGAQALVARAQQTRANLVTVYGDATRGGSPVVPLSGSTVHSAVVATIAALRTDFGAYGIANITAGAQPAPATVVLGPGGMGTIAGDTSFGVGYRQLGNTRRAGIGDVDLTATYLLFDSFKTDQVKRLLSPTRGVRTNLTLGWRFGTAGADRTEDAFDVPIGEGANALLARSTTDVLFNRWAWMSATIRAVRPLSDQMATVMPLRDEGGTFAAPVSATSATRALGPRLDVELAPRVAIGEFFGLSAAYLLRRWGSDDFTSTATSGTATTVQQFATPSRSLSAAALGLSFSTLSSYVRGRSRFPAEVVYTHTIPLAASGGELPAVASDRLELRVYTGFPRR
jgi:hypothetical protein